MALRIADIILTKDRIAVVKVNNHAESYGERGATRFRSDEIVVDLYDRKWKLLKTIALNRNYELFVPLGRSVGVSSIGEKLHLVMPALDGILKFATVYARIGLDNLQLETFTTLPRENIKNMMPIEGASTIWQPKGALIEYLVEGSFRKKEYSSVWQKFEF